MILLKSGGVLSGGKLEIKDVLIKDGRIAAIGANLDIECGEVYDARGCWIAPGITDVHAHLREPGFVHKETVYTGTRSAAKGGITSVMAMPNLLPCPDSKENLAVELAAIAGGAAIKVYPYAALTVGEKGERLADIRALAELVKGFSDDGRCVNNLALLEEAMLLVKSLGGMIASHTEAAGYTGTDAESAAVVREAELAVKTGCKYHFCHLSVKDSFDAVRAAKKAGADITCEVTPHHLFLDESNGIGDTLYKMAPPLRSVTDREETLYALLDGTADMIATDHAPHALHEKALPYDLAPCGITNFETLAPLVYTGLVKTGLATYNDMQNWLTVNPSARFGIPYPKIEEGSIADIAVLDISHDRLFDKAKTLSKSYNTPFSGSMLYGTPVLTLVSGKVVYDNDRRMQ